MLITTQVIDEIDSGIAAGYGELSMIVDAVQKGKIKVTPLEPGEYSGYGKLLPRLGSGEASVITCTSRGRRRAEFDRYDRGRLLLPSQAATGHIVNRHEIS